MKGYKLDQYFESPFTTSHPTTQVAFDADSLPTYRVYEENNETAVANGDCAKRDDANTTGAYYARAQCTAAAGFEIGKVYSVLIFATVNSVNQSAWVDTFRIIPAEVWDALYGGTDKLQADLQEWKGSSAPNLPANLADLAIAAGTGRVTVGTNADKTGYALSTAGVTAVQTGLSTLSAQQVWEYGTRTLSSFGTLVADVAAAVWSVATSTLTGDGTIGKKLADWIVGKVLSYDTGQSPVDALNSYDPPTRAELTSDKAEIINAMPDEPLDATATQTAAAAALTAYDPPTKAELDSAQSAIVSAMPGEPDNAGIAAIKTQTDKLHFTGDTGEELVNASAEATVDLTEIKGVGFDPATDTLKQLRDAIDVVSGTAGPGATAKTILIEDASHNPIANAGVWLSADEVGANVIAGTLYTNASGLVTFMVDVGSTYYVWTDTDRANFTNPYEWLVS